MSITLNLKNLFTLKSIILIVFISLFLNFMCLGLFMMHEVYNLVILMITILSSGLAFISIYEFNNSSLWKNMGLTKNKTFYYWTNSLITIIIFSYFSNFVMVSWTSIFINTNSMLSTWSFLPSQSTTFSLKSLTFWSMYLYQILIISLLTFAMLFGLKQIFKTKKSQMIFILVLILFVIPLGGSINNWMYSNYNYGFPTASSNGKVNQPYYEFSYIFPYYSSGQILHHTIISLVDSSTDSAFIKPADTVDPWVWMKEDTIVNSPTHDFSPWRWNIMYILPPIEIITFIIIGSIIDKRNY